MTSPAFIGPAEVVAYLVYDREKLVKVWRINVCRLYETGHSRWLFVYLQLADQFILRACRYFQLYVLRGTVHHDCISIDKSFIDIVDVIKDDKNIALGKQAPVPNIGKEIRLHYRHFHDVLPTRVNILQISSSNR